MNKHTLAPIGLCLALGFALTVFTGCRESSLVEGTTQTEAGVLMDVDEWVESLMEALGDSSYELHLTASADAGYNELDGLFYNKYRRPLSKAADPDPDCLLGEGAGVWGQRKFRRCVRKVLAACELGTETHLEGGDIHVHSKCD